MEAAESFTPPSAGATTPGSVLCSTGIAVGMFFERRGTATIAAEVIGVGLSATVRTGVSAGDGRLMRGLIVGIENGDGNVTGAPTKMLPAPPGRVVTV